MSLTDAWDAVTHVKWEVPLRVLLHIQLTNVNHVAYKMRNVTQGAVTEWRRPIGCLRLQVILRKTATKYRVLLRKLTCKHKASYGSSPPCTHTSHKYASHSCYTYTRNERWGAGVEYHFQEIS